MTNALQTMLKSLEKESTSEESKDPERWMYLRKCVAQYGQVLQAWECIRSAADQLIEKEPNLLFDNVQDVEY
jgi:hypothetical protein